MTLNDILMGIQANVDRSAEDIDYNDEDTKVRITLINRGIERWAQDNTTEWQELLLNEVVGTIKAGTKMLPLPDGFQFLDAVLDENGWELEIKNIREANTVGRYFYVSGNKSDDYSLNLGWVPDANDALVGQKIRVKASREPELLSDRDDVPEMSQPEFLVQFVTAELMIDDDTSQYSKYSNDWLLTLSNMRQQNERLAAGQEASAFDDYATGLGE